MISPLRGAKGNLLGWILEGRPRLHIILIISTLYHAHFGLNQVFPLAGNDVIVLSLRGGAAAELYVWILKGRHNFILVFNGNHTSITHRFRYNQVFPLAGNDVIVLSPREDAAGKF